MKSEKWELENGNWKLEPLVKAMSVPSSPRAFTSALSSQFPPAVLRLGLHFRFSGFKFLFSIFHFPFSNFQFGFPH